MKKVIIASDSFKHSLSSTEAGKYLKQGMLEKIPSLDINIIPVADGGEGTIEALVDATNGQIKNCTVSDPLGRKIDAVFGVSGDKETGFIEMAKASGLELLKEKDRNPLRTSTYGTGELIKAVLDQGCNTIILGIGGSATVDGGAGVAAALGIRFLNKSGDAIYPVGGNLNQITSYDSSALDKRLLKTNILIASDVDNPLTGQNGAAAVYGPQKGASPKDIHQLEQNLCHFAQIITKQKDESLVNTPGTGAAGGLPASLLTFTHAQIKNGFSTVADFLNLEDKFEMADLIITGEGKIDAQTQYGKAPFGVARLAKKHKKQVIAVTGSLEKEAEIFAPEVFDKIFTLATPPFNLQKMIQQTPEALIKTGRKIGNLIKQESDQKQL